MDLWGFIWRQTIFINGACMLADRLKKQHASQDYAYHEIIKDLQLDLLSWIRDNLLSIGHHVRLLLGIQGMRYYRTKIVLISRDTKIFYFISSNKIHQFLN